MKKNPSFTPRHANWETPSSAVFMRFFLRLNVNVAFGCFCWCHFFCAFPVRSWPTLPNCVAPEKILLPTQVVVPCQATRVSPNLVFQWIWKIGPPIPTNQNTNGSKRRHPLKRKIPKRKKLRGEQKSVRFWVRFSPFPSGWLLPTNSKSASQVAFVRIFAYSFAPPANIRIIRSQGANANILPTLGSALRFSSREN